MRDLIGDHALISDCHGSALVDREGRIDWCSLPRFDSPSCFAAILDEEIGGFCQFKPMTFLTSERRYLESTLVLETVFTTETGRVRLLDCMTMPPSEEDHQILRVLDCVSGHVEVEAVIEPALEYGAVKPWIRPGEDGGFSVVGGSTGLWVTSTLDLDRDGPHRLAASAVIREGDRAVLAITHATPAQIDEESPPERDDTGTDLDETIRWWRDWSANTNTDNEEALRSAIVLKGLCYQPSGAMVAAPTTSLPESLGGERNWDYRYSWVRDSAFAARALIALGFDEEATRFRRFIERSAAGRADEIQPLYGIDGEIRILESELEHLSGHRDSVPVRVGNVAFRQKQLDGYGYILELAWRWHLEGITPSGLYWEFLTDLVDHTCDTWSEADRGIWEVRSEGLHFVHSKVMAWATIDIGIRLAQELEEHAPVERWRDIRDQIRATVETRGYDTVRGVFTRSLESSDLDAALLLLPWVEFVDFDDPRMVRTADAIRDELGHDGLVRRYTADDGLTGREGTFVACTFWLAECLARQGREDEAREVYDTARAVSNDLGLFGEEYDPVNEIILGNFPQALSHLSHITATLALAESNTRG